MGIIIYVVRRDGNVIIYVVNGITYIGSVR